MKSLNKIDLIEINLQTNLSKLGGVTFVGDRIRKKDKTVLKFYSLISVKIFYTPHAYITQKITARKFFKYNTKIDRENMQELATYLVIYLTRDLRNTEYN